MTSHSLTPEQMQHYWMPFTANRQFKAAPRLLARAEGIQAKTVAMTEVGLEALMGLLDHLEAAERGGATPEQLSAARQAQRRATWYLDFILAENSSGFHAPQEAARVLFLAMDSIRSGHLVLAGVASATPAPPREAG